MHRNLHNMHQCVATKVRAGRVSVTGDWRLVNNPIGRLGLNFCIHDAADLVDALSAHVFAGAAEATLGGYERRRRALNGEFVQRQATDYKRRLEGTYREARRARLDDLRASTADPARARASLLRTSLIESVRQARAIAG